MSVAASHLEEDLAEVDEVRRVSLCYNCEMMGHFAGASGRKGKGKGKGERRRQGMQERKQGKRRKAREREVQANLDKNRKAGDTMDRAGRAARLDTSHEKVDGASPASTRKKQTAEKAGDYWIQKNVARSECRSSGTWRKSRSERELASITHTARWKNRAKYWATEDRRGELHVTRESFPRRIY